MKAGAQPTPGGKGRDHPGGGGEDGGREKTILEVVGEDGGGSRCLVLIAVCLGLICVLQLVDSSTGVLQFIMITEERDLLKTYKNTFEEFSQTIKSLQANYTDLMNEKDQLQNNFSSLSQKKLELETRVENLISVKSQLLELESKVTSLSDELKEAYEKGYQWGSGWFFISSVSMSWSDSRQYCRNQGGDLIIINTEEKQKFITSLVNEYVWIGLSDREQEGNMKWVDNSPLKQGFWGESQPDDYGGSEDCVELIPLRPVLNWNDVPCSDRRKGICEK